MTAVRKHPDVAHVIDFHTHMLDADLVRLCASKNAITGFGKKEPPTFHGASYNLMRDDPATSADEAHMFEPHYDLHVWLFRDNPNGTFAPFNPNVSCAAAPVMAAGHEHMEMGKR